MPKVSRTVKFRGTAAASKSSVVSTPSKPQAAKQIESVIEAGKDNLVVQDTESQTTEKNVVVKESNAKRLTAILSRGQRKRLAKREQYMRKEQMVLSSLRLKRQEEQKKRIDGLDAIKEALLETVKVGKNNVDQGENDETKPNLLKSNKSRQQLLEKEVTQMNLVMQHPAFQADPFATIREHLKNTLSKDIDKHKKQAFMHLRERKEKEEHNKAVKKENGVKRKRKRFKATRSKSR